MAELVTTTAIGRHVVHLAVCGSTNDEAARLAREGAPHGTLVVADAQEHGRGRQGRSWWSPPGESLYASFVLRPALPADRAPPITLAAGAAVAETVVDAGVEAALKWPNDVLARGSGKKLAGLLTEMSTSEGRVGWIVLGIGLNVGNRAFPDELADRATSLALEGATPTRATRAVVCAALCLHLERQVERYVVEGPPAAARAWRAFGDPAGQRMRVQAGARQLEGVAEGIDDDGALLFTADDGNHYRIHSGEVLP
jgi:BirA family biotin operon repressor/biotin-[acetyl-CoA-carboxylase] ligase